MEKPEFSKWLDHFGAAFPDVKAWLQSEKAGPPTLDVWRGVIEPLDFRDARQAVERLVAGLEAAPEHWSGFPATIRQIASRLRQQRQPPRPSPKLEPRSKHKLSAQHALVLKALDRGKTKSQALKMLAVAFPIDENDLPRYKCITCRDSGHVRVWHSETVNAVLAGDEHPKIYEGVVLCTCQAGYDRQREPVPGEFRRVQRYDHENLCLWKTGQIEELRAWMQDVGLLQLAGAE